MGEPSAGLAPAPSPAASGPTLARRLGPFDATMLVMGGIIGSGIFANPHEVALEVHSRGWILGAWMAGGVVALLGAFVYAELSSRRPEVGGQYAYLREAYHPSVAFLYGWALLLVTQTGGMAAVAVIFARFFRSLTGAAWPDWSIALVAIAALTAINCFGVRAGSTVQNVLMVLKIGAVLALVGAGLWVAPAAALVPAAAGATGIDVWTAFGAALAPVLFAYGGWQTAGFVSGELRDPRRDMPRGLLLGVAGVIVLYLAVNFACVRVLGVDGLASSTTPASDVMRAAFGAGGARWIEIGITVSTLGFLSQGMLTAPRVYYAMAQDGLFFRRIGELSTRTRVPVTATVLQGIASMAIAAWGKYSQILAFSISMDFLFFGLTGAALFVLRRADDRGEPRFRAPGHPWSTGAFVATCFLFVGNILYKKPHEAGIGLLIVLSGLPVYALWRALRRDPVPERD